MAGAGSHLIIAGNLACCVWLAGWSAFLAGLRMPRLGALATAGLIAIVGAIYCLLGCSPEPFGAMLLVSAAGLFAAEAACTMQFLAGGAGTAVILCWFCSVAASRPLATAAACVPGAALACLAAKAGEAHRKKRRV